MLLTESGLQLSAFDTTMASLVGSDASEVGANLLVQAGRNQHRRVELWDWFYLLLKAPMKTVLRTEFVDAPGMNVDGFIGDVEAAFELAKEHRGSPPGDHFPDGLGSALKESLWIKVFTFGSLGHGRCWWRPWRHNSKT